jgi:membrane protease YdiL (CAAX protease family)
VVARRDGVNSLLRKLNPQGQWLWIPVLVAAGVACTAVAALITGVRIAWSPWFAVQVLAAHLLLQFVFVGCGEELGWRGWLLPRLLTTYRPASATALVAGVWGFWHMPILLTGFRTAMPFLFGVFGLSFLFTALWQRVKGNIFVLAVAHASVNAPIQMLNQQHVTDAVFVLYGVLGLAVFIRMMMRPALFLTL